MRHLTRYLLAIAVLVLLAGPAYAQAPPPAPAPEVVVTSGEATVRRAPDRAWVTIAAESRAATAEEAQRQNVDAMSAVSQKIKAGGIPADAIQTTGYNLQPEFDWTGGRQRLKGYV